MKKFFTFIILCILSSNVIHAGITWTLSGDGTLTISGTDMPDYTSSPWFSQREKIKQVVIKNGVTNIGAKSFFGCYYIQSIAIPNSVTSIGENAFYDCYNIQSIAIPNSVTSIGENAFNGCYNIQSITIPNSVTSIGGGAFSGCFSLTSVTIPNSVTSIGENAFNGCSKLTSITIPNSVTSIGSGAFRGTSLTSVTIPNSVTSIGSGAFYSCTNLTSVTIPNSITNIYDGTFWYCYSLTSITIPNSVMNIGANAFRDCYNLQSITITNSVMNIGANAFRDCYNLQSITITNPNPPSCAGKETFICSTTYVRDTYDVYNYATLHVPMGSKEAYSSAYEWRYFNKIKEDMEQDGKVYYANLSVKQGTTGYTEQPVKADETYTIYIGALGDSKINAVTFNGKDVTDQVKNGYYTTPAIKAKSILSISYEDSNITNAKEITNPALKVTGNEGEINISGIDNPTNVEIYTTDGKLVATKGTVSGDTSIQVKEDELYLVKVGKRTIKIAM